MTSHSIFNAIVMKVIRMKTKTDIPKTALSPFASGIGLTAKKNLMPPLCIFFLIFVNLNVFAQEAESNFGFFQGNLSELAPRSIQMTYTVNDPPGTFSQYDTGYFEYKMFDVDQRSRSVKGSIQLNINATKWIRPLPGRKNYDYNEKRTDHAGGYVVRAKMSAGNIDLDASLNVSGTLVNASAVPDVKSVLHEMISKIPKK
jgi:hypothetical protein